MGAMTLPVREKAPGPEVINLGCRLNAYEGDRAGMLAGAAGLSEAVVVNSCAVTNEAVRSTRRAIRRAARDNPDATIVVTGCAAQIDPQSFAAMDEVDVVLGNDEKLRAQEWSRIAGGEPARVRVNDIMSVRETAGHLTPGYGERSRAFLEIQNGCDHRCTFCVIPFGRGPSRSTPVAAVAAEAVRLTEAGAREIVLTGVDVTSYGHDLPGAPSLGRLVEAILDAAPKLFRLRLSSIDGAEIDDLLFDLIAGEARVAPYLHLSLQSGDDMILKRMKRRHDRAQAIAFCETLRRRRPEIAFGADIIAGFPTEDEAMFANSLSLVDEAGLAYVHVFPFSPRDGTPAARMPQLPRATIKERAARLRDKAAAAEAAFHRSLIGRKDRAVMETGGVARLGNFALARIDDPSAARPGDIVDLRVVAASENGGLQAEALPG